VSNFGDTPENIDPTQPETLPRAGAPSPSDAPSPLGSLSGFPVLPKQDGPVSIDAYQLLEKLGEGGMGQVWLAEQTSPVRRQVAIKLIRNGIYDGSVIRRFKAEQQSLAIMDHPGIAKVFGAGSTPSGQPYFVMEYVPGLPLTRYCDERKLKIRERLELFIRVCDGVQHAHQKAIIHRDLKPSNILVVDVDGKSAPRIIDFGIAKAMSKSDADDTVVTLGGAPMGTPGYMSPEQANPRQGDVDTRTDVYSLGVILYELLAGAHPLDSRPPHEQPRSEVLRQLNEDEPPSPSARLREDEKTCTAAALKRGTDPKHLVTVLHGDLDWITMKAMERDRARRYGTPSELATDIGRYLRSEPVLARPASSGYRLKKYIGRHRLGVTAAGVLAALLVAFAVTQGVELRRITRERDRADRITQIMTKMFEVSNPSEARGNSITAREILDKSSQQIDSDLAKDPDLQAQMSNVMGNVYEKLGLYSRAKPLLEKSAQTRTRILGPKDPVTLRSMDDLGWILFREGQYPEAEKLLRKTLEERRLVLGSDNMETAESAMHLAATLAGESRYSEAGKLDQEAVDISKRLLGPEHPFTLVTMTNLGGTLQQEGRLEESKAILWKTLSLEQDALGPEHPTTLLCRTILGTTLIEMGEYAEAEKLQEQTRDIQIRVLGGDHPETAISTYNLACLAAKMGEHDRSLDLLREAVTHGLPIDAVLAMEDDKDLQEFHDDARFKAILADAKRQVAQAQKAH
jgi:serine/threonine protein kinase